MLSSLYATKSNSFKIKIGKNYVPWHQINVGCGTYLTNWMFECETNTDIRHRKLWNNFVRSNVLHHGEMFDKNSFDYAFCSHLFEHLNIPQIKKAMKCLEKISWNVIILVPTGEHFLSQFYRDHVTLWPEDGLAINKRSQSSFVSTVQ